MGYFVNKLNTLLEDEFDDLLGDEPIDDIEDQFVEEVEGWITAEVVEKRMGYGTGTGWQDAMDYGIKYNLKLLKELVEKDLKVKVYDIDGPTISGSRTGNRMSFGIKIAPDGEYANPATAQRVLEYVEEHWDPVIPDVIIEPDWAVW
jgi:hypothetical protein